MRGHWMIGVSIWLLGVLGCSNLPGYAAPRGYAADPSAVDQGDLISYRTLARSDFKAENPPAEAAQHAKQLGALTCAYLMTQPQTTFTVQEERKPDADSRFFASWTKLGFAAFMDRNCSWWNPESTADDEAYVLEHEQIHFALTELAARRLNARVPQLMTELRAEADTQQEAQSRVRELLREVLDDAQQDLLDMNLEFDEETSAERNPALQQQWSARVQTELRQP